MAFTNDVGWSEKLHTGKQGRMVNIDANIIYLASIGTNI